MARKTITGKQLYRAFNASHITCNVWMETESGNDELVEYSNKQYPADGRYYWALKHINGG